MKNKEGTTITTDYNNNHITIIDKIVYVTSTRITLYRRIIENYKGKPGDEPKIEDIREDMSADS